MGRRNRLAAMLRAVRGDKNARYALAERLAQTIHPDAFFGEEGKMWLHDDGFRQICQRFAAEPRRWERVYLLDQLARLVPAIEGDTAECGVYTGLTSYMICRRIEGTGKLHYAFDSWEGLSAPIDGEEQHWHQGELAAPEQTARRNLADFDFARFYKGWIPNRFEEVADRTFAFVHLDVDLYEPTRDALAFFHPRLAPGAFMLFDDYGLAKCPGVRHAIDEFFVGRAETVVALPTSQALVFHQPS